MIRALFATLLASLLLSTPAAARESGTALCGATHTPRGVGLNEMLDTSIGLLNGNLDSSVTITRLTIRNFFGDIVHDSGPAVGVPHPLNTDPNPDQDITTVPPGATYYITTSHVWPGNGFVPDPVPGRLGGGNGMSVHVKFITDGKPELFVVTTGRRGRERIETSPGSGIFFQGGEKTRGGGRKCDLLK